MSKYFIKFNQTLIILIIFNDQYSYQVHIPNNVNIIYHINIILNSVIIYLQSLQEMRNSNILNFCFQNINNIPLLI